MNRNAKNILLGVLLWLTVLVFTSVVVISVEHHQSPSTTLQAMLTGKQESVWSRWNRAVYEDIAVHGYTFRGPHVDFGFWPLWPILIRLAAVVVPYLGLATLTMSLVIILSACWLLYRLVAIDESETIARDTVWWLIVAPVSFIFFMPFSEALFLFCVLAALYAGRRGHWLLAGIASAGAMLARHAGVLLLVPLAIEWWSQGVHQRRDWLSLPPWLGLSLLGALAFPFYVFMRTGGLFAAFDYQRSGFGHAPSHPVAELWRYAAAAGRDPVSALQFLLFSLGAIGVIWCVALARRGQLRPSYGWYAALLFLFPMFSSGNLIGIPRYTIVLFPLYILLAKKIRRRKIRIGVMVVSFVIQLLLFVSYLRVGIVVM